MKNKLGEWVEEELKEIEEETQFLDSQFNPYKLKRYRNDPKAEHLRHINKFKKWLSHIGIQRAKDISIEQKIDLTSSFGITLQDFNHEVETFREIIKKEYANHKFKRSKK